MIEVIKNILPEAVKLKYHAYQQKKQKKIVNSLPKINEKEFENILINDLGINTGDNLFIHSSLDKLNLDFPFFNVLSIIKNLVGEQSTIAFPTYPLLNSYKLLKSNQIFDIRKSPSFTGILSELARRQKNSVRSLHPTKSVTAIGPLANEWTNSHNASPYPYDYNSPYYKINLYNTKIIGIGIRSTYLSAVHSCDDTMRNIFPVNPYHKEIFDARCINYEGKEEIVKTYAHDMKMMHFDLPTFFKKNIDSEIVQDIDIKGMKYFKADAKKLYEKMTELAKIGITIYNKSYYNKK